MKAVSGCEAGNIIEGGRGGEVDTLNPAIIPPPSHRPPLLRPP